MDKIKKMRPKAAKNPEKARKSASGGSIRANRAKSGPESGPESKPDPESRPAAEVEPDPTRYGDWQVKGRCIDF